MSSRARQWRSDRDPLLRYPKLRRVGRDRIEILCVGPGKTSGGCVIEAKVLFLEVRKDEPGTEINARFSVHRCKLCYSPHNRTERPRFVSWAISKYMLHKTDQRNLHPRA